jgi:type I restriction enzyme, S subunit
MQQLLTGRTRLPAFALRPDGTLKGYKPSELGDIPDDWELCELQDAVLFLDGQRRPVKSGDRAKIAGIYPYYGASGIVDYVNDYIFDEELILLGEDGENILSRSVPLAFKVSGKIWVNNHAHVLSPKKDFHIGFLTEYLESLDYSLLNSGTAQPKLNKQTCQKIKIVKPGCEEQTAIATILSDMDNEQQVLTQKLEKARALKQGMMQQLLTGKIRLPLAVQA